jgi:ribosomal protein S15P/S13E
MIEEQLDNLQEKVDELKKHLTEVDGLEPRGKE